MNATLATDDPDVEIMLIEDETVLVPIVPAPALPRRAARALRRAVVASPRVGASVSDWVFGALALTVGLSLLAATPIAQLLAFGYLLEASGRVSRTGKLRAGLIGVRKASRVGSMVIGVLLGLAPLWFLSSLANAAQLVEPNSRIARGWKIILMTATVVMVLHILGACARGGRIRHFVLPFGNPFWIVRRLRGGGAYAAARDAVGDFTASLRLPYYFRLGFLGFVGTMIWLVLPVSLLAAGSRFPLLNLPGILLLGLVVVPLPYLQARFAAENRFAAMFELRRVRDRFKHAPWAFTFALMLLLVGALPLYLLKIEIIPREMVALPSLVFLVFMFPARVLTGWAYGRSLRRDRPRHWFIRWTGRLAIVPVVLVYLLIVFFSQFTAWRGVYSLYEQHAFLLPVPFLGF